jgi:hypothetical protein
MPDARHDLQEEDGKYYQLHETKLCHAPLFAFHPIVTHVPLVLKVQVCEDDGGEYEEKNQRS